MIPSKESFTISGVVPASNRDLVSLSPQIEGLWGFSERTATLGASYCY
jgi:hypothetical protein